MKKILAVVLAIAVIASAFAIAFAAETAPVAKDPNRSYSMADEFEPWVWEVAVNNENFRQAIFHGINRLSTYYVETGDVDLAYSYMQNTVTPVGLATDLNGVDYTDNAAFGDIKSADFFNPAAAAEYRDAAIAELSEQGVSFPVKVLVRYNPTVTNWEEECVILEQQLEAVLNDGVDFIDVIVEAGPTTGFLGAVRRSSDYMLLLCNWGADYNDPETFSEPFYQAKSSSSPNGYNRGGRYAYMAYAISDGMAAGDTVAEYFDLVEKAMATTADQNARMDAFAAAEAYMINHALVVPYGLSVADYTVSRLNPFEGQYAGCGISNNRYKGQHLLKDFMSMDMYNAAQAGQDLSDLYVDTDNDSFRYLYSGELTTINYLTTGNSNEHAIGANVIDTLVEYDSNSEIQPSLAKSWDYDKDTMTWTFNLRDDATWVDSNGNYVANVTAADFVAAAKYVLDPAMGSSTANLIYDIVANAEDYYDYMFYLENAQAEVVEEDGTTYSVDEAGVVTITSADGSTDTVAPVAFEDVGVKAVDDYTLQYTLVKDAGYFLSLTTYVTYMPAYGPQLEELGTSFATSADTMLYNGAYYIQSYEPQVQMTLAKNGSNWDAEKVYIESIKRIYNAEASTIGAEMAKRGEIDQTSLSADIVDAWLADSATANMVTRERPSSDFAYYYCFNFNVGALDDSFYRP